MSCIPGVRDPIAFERYLLSRRSPLRAIPSTQYDLDLAPPAVPKKPLTSTPPRSASTGEDGTQSITQ
jgi:hypothetical protein